MISLIKVSIIIVNFNTADLLDKCIESILKKCTGNNYEIIVVDNNSNDNSIDMISEKYKMVRIVTNKCNYGFGKANNIGVMNAKGEYVLLLNSDTIVLNNIVNEFLDYYENSEDKIKIGCVGAWLYDSNFNITSSEGFFPTKRQIIRDYINIILGLDKKNKVINDGNIKDNIKVKYVDYLVGALLFMKKEIYQAFGGFDENFFMYFEETDLQFRMKEKNYNRIIINTPKVIHLEGKSPNISNKKRIIYSESMYKYFKKRTPKFKYLLFKIITISFRLPTFMKRQYSFRENVEFFKSIIKI